MGSNNELVNFFIKSTKKISKFLLNEKKENTKKK